MATQFDLEQAIARHIASISAHGSLTAGDAKELASHLFDTVELLTKQGLSSEEAFIIATRRLGPERQLAAEYEKVNPSVKVNRIWAYLLFGFLGLTGLFYLGKSLLFLLYGSALKNGDVTTLTVLVVSASHVVLCGLIALMVHHKRAIGAYLQHKLRKRPLLMLINAAFVLMLASGLERAMTINTKFQDVTSIAIYEFKNPAIEFTFYLLLFFLFIGVISMFFTVRNPENSDWKSVFSRPSIALLLIVGLATECLAAATRIMPPHHHTWLLSGLYFGLVYFIGAAVLSYYNNTKHVHYLIWYSAVGVLVEVILGIPADILRVTTGGPILTPYFVGGLLGGVMAGYFAGQFLRKIRLQPKASH